MDVDIVTGQLTALMASGRFSTEDLFSIQPIVVLTLALEAGPESWTDEDYEDVASALEQIGVSDGEAPPEEVNRALSNYLACGVLNGDLLREVFRILTEALGDGAIDLRSHAKSIGIDTTQSAPATEETQKPRVASLGSLAQLKAGSFRI